MNGQVENLQALNPGLGDGEPLLKTNLRHDSPPLLPLLRVPGLGGRLRGAPPGLVRHVPRDRLAQALGEVRVLGLPAELAAELGRVDGVAAVVAGAVAHPVEVVRVPAHGLEDHAQHRDVAPLAVRADEVGLAHAAPREDVPHGGGVVLGVDPVADVLARAVELGTHPVDDVGDLAGDELLHVLVGTVVVRAVRDRGAQAVGAGPGADEHVGARLGGGVRAARVVGGLLGEARRVVEREVAVDLVGAHVVVADAVLPHGLEQAEGALDVGPQERLGVGDGVVVVALGGVVHDGVVAGHDPLQKLGVADVAHDELDAVGRQSRDVLGVARVGELVEHGHVHVRVVVHHVVHEVTADEAAAARDDDIFRGEGLRHEGYLLVLARAVDDLAGGDLLEVPAVDRLAGEDDAFHELTSIRMPLVIVVALKLFDRQLLGKLAKLCIELRKTNAQPKADNKQDEDEEQENEVRRRHGADKIGKPEKHLGENAGKQ